MPTLFYISGFHQNRVKMETPPQSCRLRSRECLFIEHLKKGKKVTFCPATHTQTSALCIIHTVVYSSLAHQCVASLVGQGTSH